MRILVVGGGGREHALVWKIAQSPLVTQLFCAPGNPGIARHAECVPIRPDDVAALADFAAERKIDLTVVGPEAPLVAGIVDRFESDGLPIFGPSTDPARIEGSKVFSKRLMRSAGIPTAEFWVCESEADARGRVRDFFAMHGPDARLVVKADGLAAGKGVVVCQGEDEAQTAVRRIMGAREFGAAGDSVVIEECLVGEEASIMAITDGTTILPLAPSQDHKRAFDGDRGPNTGGMGAYSPVPILPPDVVQEAVNRVLRPAVAAVADLGLPYQGVLYAGIMVTDAGVKTIEFNCRFGDPETQVVLPLLESDIVPLLLGAVECTLDKVQTRWSGGAAVTVVAASGGYPGDYETGKPITGLDAAAQSPGCTVFHAGTKEHAGQVVTAGGRVLTVTGVAPNLPEAAANAYAGLAHIEFDGMHYRKDIGSRSLIHQT